MRNAMLIGERVYLRPLEKSDAEVIARGMRFRPEGASIDGVASPIVIDGERMIAATGAPPLPA